MFTDLPVVLINKAHSSVLQLGNESSKKPETHEEPICCKSGRGVKQATWVHESFIYM